MAMRGRSLGTAMLVVAFVAAVVAAPATASAQDKMLPSGELGGKNGHAASGRVSVVKGSRGIQVVIEPDFKFDGAPDPKLGFGTNGYV